jgi:hypothetical protein
MSLSIFIMYNTQMHIHIHTHTLIYRHTHIYTYIHTHVHIHTYIHACMHACISTYIHSHTHIYIDVIYLHTHTYIYIICMYVFLYTKNTHIYIAICILYKCWGGFTLMYHKWSAKITKTYGFIQGSGKQSFRRRFWGSMWNFATRKKSVLEFLQMRTRMAISNTTQFVRVSGIFGRHLMSNFEDKDNNSWLLFRTSWPRRQASDIVYQGG